MFISSRTTLIFTRICSRINTDMNRWITPHPRILHTSSSRASPWAPSLLSLIPSPIPSGISSSHLFSPVVSPVLPHLYYLPYAPFPSLLMSSYHTILTSILTSTPRLPLYSSPSFSSSPLSSPLSLLSPLLLSLILMNTQCCSPTVPSKRSPYE